MGIKEWNDEFIHLLEILKVSYESKLVNVGIGAGLEGVGVYDRFKEFVAVDISRSALKAVIKTFPNAIAKYGEAEALPQEADQCDVYVSLKTYSSSFFDIHKAVSSLSKNLKSGGTAIISVPRGYYNGETFIPGIAPTNYSISALSEGNKYGAPDELLPLRLAQSISAALYAYQFQDVKWNSGRHEMYISATRP
jgi:ubiquinone/menaquinone biosynthesis C-methylase UbiE